jgi:hypothetical protein
MHEVWTTEMFLIFISSKQVVIFTFMGIIILWHLFHLLASEFSFSDTAYKHHVAVIFVSKILV